MDAPTVIGEIDQDALSDDEPEEIMRKQSSFWQDPKVQPGDPCGIQGCANYAVNRCVYQHACKKGCDRGYCYMHGGTFAIENKYGEAEF